MLDKSDKLTDINNTLDEKGDSYYTDVYSPGETKEQLVVGNEVRLTQSSGTIDTSDSGLTTTDNIYTLSIADPDGEIFSIGITGNGEYVEKTFKIGFYNNTPLAYSTLETQMQDWLGDDYIVSYVSGTNFSLERLDKQEISLSSPNLVRNIELTDFNTHSKIDVIVDGTTVQLLGSTHSGSESTAITYLKGQLSSSTYHMDDDGDELIIARKDGAVPVITSTQYNRYTYTVTGDRNSTTANPDSATLGGSGGTANVKTYQMKATTDGIVSTFLASSGITFAAANYNTVPTNFTGYAATTDSNSYTAGAMLLDQVYGNLTASYTKGSISLVGGPPNHRYTFDYHKNDYSQLTYSQDFKYVLDSGLSLVSDTYASFTHVEDANVASITVTTYTEIAKSLTLASGSYWIPVSSRYTKIQIKAVSSGGSSEGVYEKREQSCTAKYSSTTAFVADYIFKTDATNYGEIIEVRKLGFVISWTTDKSNKLDYVCT